MSLLRSSLCWLGIAWLVFLTGCSTLPAHRQMPQESAAAVTGHAHLDRYARQAPIEGLSGFRLLPDAVVALDARIALIRAAERSLDLQYYFFRCDAIGLQVVDELKDAAARGVRVRLIVDDLHVDQDDTVLLELSSTPNVQVRLFNPLPARNTGLVARILSSLHELPRINRRMHNKLLVADNTMSVSGGRNIGREYFMESEDANFIDIDVLSVGPVVQQQSAGFDAYWNSRQVYPAEQVARRAGAVHSRPISSAAAAMMLRLDPLGRSLVSMQLAAGALDLIWAPAQAFVDAPSKIEGDSMEKRFAGSVTQRTLGVITGAQSSVVIISPYFIPGEVGLGIMRDAQRRGIATTVLTNSLGATDEALVYFAYAKYRKDMLRAGVSLYELSPILAKRLRKLGSFGKSQGRLHAKMALIDGRQMFIGSMNLDGRSASLNTETGLLIESEELVRDFLKLMPDGRFRGAYELRLTPGDAIQWIDHDKAEGTQEVLDREPDMTPGVALKQLLLTPFLLEEHL